MAPDEAYREAEQKIEEARRSGAKKLDLSVPWGDEKTPKLTELPESLAQLTQLQSLNLFNNQLTALPESLGQLKQLQSLDLSRNQLAALPESLGQLTQLQSLNLSSNRLTALPESLGQLTQLESLNLSGNRLTALPEPLRHLRRLTTLDAHDAGLRSLPTWSDDLVSLEMLNLAGNNLTSLPDSLGRLARLKRLYLGVDTGNPLKVLPACICGVHSLERLDCTDCQLTELPAWVARLECLQMLDLGKNPLNPELAAAYKEGLGAVKRYLRAKAEAQVVLNEAKLILIGEGEVGKSCLLGALRGDPWEEGRPTTHGIEIKPVKVTDPKSGTEMTLNAWDFGGQRVYRPTHQLFFTAPAVYLVVWKPREGPQQGFVKEWIKLVKHREPEARVLVVATHGGPRERQPDIDRQEIWDLFGKDTVIDFFHVESRPDEKTGERRGIAELTDAIARVAAGLPEMGRSVPKHWQEVRAKLCKSKEAYLPLHRVLALCKEHKIEEEEDARLLLRVCRRVGDLIHYEHDPALRDVVVLKPDWLATAVSFVLDDEETRKEAHGLVSFARLGRLWHDPERPAENRYPAELHPVFLRLMERFDLSYRVAEAGKVEADGTSLIAQLVPDVRPDPVAGWAPGPGPGDVEQVQICRIVDADKNQSAVAEGLFYQLIVRLHKYSLGRADYAKSVHWQRGLVLEDDTGARAFLEHAGNDVRIAVRSPYPERFLAALTYEVKWLVESFWKGMRCEVTVPCLARRKDGGPCTGLFEVGKLIENKGRRRPEQPCPLCNEWQSIEELLHNAPAARPSPIEELLLNSAEVMRILHEVRRHLGGQEARIIGRFDRLDAASREIVSKVEAAYSGVMHALVDEAKEGPRLFSFEPVERSRFSPKGWTRKQFRVTLWCEHSRLPLPMLNERARERGVYVLDVPRDWLVQAAPLLKLLAGTLSLVLPVAASATKLAVSEDQYKAIGSQLELGKSCAEAMVKVGEKVLKPLEDAGVADLEVHGATGGIRAQGAILRQLQAWLKEKDPGFGGLVRVMNKRQEFLWVHPQFEGEY